MSGTPNPDPAFLNNVPTAVSSTVSLSTASPFSPGSTIVALSPSSTSAIPSPTASTSTSDSSPTPQPESTSLYFYNPSNPVPIIFSTLYFILVLYHFYLSIYRPFISRNRPSQKHKRTICLLIAAIISTLGFSLRIASVSSAPNRTSIPLYALSSTYIIIAPIFICATLYLLLTHLIRLCLPEDKPQTRVFLGLSPRWLGRAFITSDVLSFLCQASGSGIAASDGWTGQMKDVGTGVLIFGLAAQLATFSVFMVVLYMFCARVQRGSIANDQSGGRELLSTNGQKAAYNLQSREADTTREFGFNPLAKQVLKGIWIASILVEIRSLYRLIEFATGISGYLFTHEWPLWVFEATPMFVALLALGFYHPSVWLQQKRRSRFLGKSAAAITVGGGEVSGRERTGAGEGREEDRRDERRW